MDEESQHWADQYAESVIERVNGDKKLAEVVKKHGYIVYDEKTPSGKIHIGSGRGWVIHDAVAKALREKGVRGRFILSSDDIDPFDKMNADLPKEFEQYLGKPFRDIPSPVPGFKSYADYYFTDCTQVFAQFGIVAELESTGDRYIRGDFNPCIKIALDNAEKINAIYERMYGKERAQLPFNPICEKCGNIGTTFAYEWDAKRELIKYHCKPDFVTWAKGCDYKGERSPYNGGGKFPWKVEWAAKWPTVGVVFETAGKDHFSHGGSRDIAVAIAEEIFDYRPPLPSDYKNPGNGYEFFTIGGQKMSTSKGRGVGFSESLHYAQGNILRYLLISTRPRAQLDFDPFNGQDLILLYDRYDKTERVFYDVEQLTNPHDVQKQKRIYELSAVGDVPKSLSSQVPLTLAGVMVQVTLNDEDAISRLIESGHLPEKLSAQATKSIKERLAFSRKWIAELAPDKFKFQIQNEFRGKLDDAQKKLVTGVVHLLEQKCTEVELHNAFYALCTELSMTPQQAFSTMYSILIGKPQGPRLASFLLTIGRERVIKLLKKVI